MPVRVDISASKVQVKIDRAWKEALSPLSEEILADCNEYCKEDTGALIQSSLIHSIPWKGRLIWQTPYARRQYWGIVTAHKDINPNATWKWAEVAKFHFLERWNRLAQKWFRENL